MDARISRVVAAWICGFLVTTTLSAQVIQISTANFVIHAPDRGLAERAGKLAEQFRRELSREWLGYEIKPWAEKCPVYIEMAPLPGGETSFAFVPSAAESQPIGWQMKIFGPPDRVLDAVLPHEITHTIFATHFGRPLPRWADEGACTTVEHASERAKNHQMLIEFLTAKPSRGIPFNRMFTMREYPHDILPLYAQGFSLAKFLIQQKGKRHFVNYVGMGLELSDQLEPLPAWNRATRQSYGYTDLSELQVSWMKWVERGCPATVERPSQGVDGVAQTDPARVDQSSPIDAGMESTVPRPLERNLAQTIVQGSWYREQMQKGKSLGNDNFERRTALDSSAPEKPDVIGGYRPGSIADVPADMHMRRPTVDRPNAAGNTPESTIWR